MKIGTYAENLGLTPTDHDVLMRTAATNGRPAAMHMLEKMAL